MSVEDRYRAAIQMAVYGTPVAAALPGAGKEKDEDREALTKYEKDIRKLIRDDDLRECPGGLIKEFEQRLIIKFRLEFDRLAFAQGFIHMQTSPGQEIEIPAKHVAYWYRALSLAEYRLLRRENQFPKKRDYAGIASNFNYSRSYVSNEADGIMVAEWHIPPEGRLVQLMEEAGINYKLEDGAVSYGLGAAGTNAGKGPTAALDIFNTYASPMFKVVYLRIPIRMPKLAQ